MSNTHPSWSQVGSVQKAALTLLAAVLAAVAPAVACAGLVTLATTGGAVPGGGTFGKHFGVPVINAAGQVAFSVFTDQQTDTDTGVYQGTSKADLTALLRPGGATTSIGRAVAQNDGGGVVFSANGGTQIVARDITGLHIVANAGDGVMPIGGGPIYTLGGFSDPAIDAHGDVAYTESGGGPFAGAVAGGELLAFNDFGVPGVPGGGLITNIGGPVSIAALSGTAFAATFLDTFEQNGVGGTAFWVGGTQELHAGVLDTDGDALAIVEPGASVPMISPAGIVFRTATFNSSTNVSNSGVFLVTDPLGTVLLTTLVKGGDPAPGGGTFASAVSEFGVDNNYIPFDEPQINDNGSIVFVAWTDGGPGHGVYRFTQAHGLEAMALEGHAPYAAAAGFRNAVINNNDVVAFQAFDGSAPTGRAVFITDGVNTVRAGSDDIFGAEGSSTGAFSQAFFGSQDEGLSPLNDHGQVTFVSLAGPAGQESVMKFSVDPKWVQPVAGDWDVAANWIFGAAPGPDSNATIPGQAAGPVVVTGPPAPATVNTLVIGTGPNTATLDLQSGGPITCNITCNVVTNGVLGGTGTVTAQEVSVAAVGGAAAGTVTGTLTLNATTVFNAGTMNGTLTFNAAVINEETGLIKGNPTFNGNVINMGTISPGNSPGTVTVNGDLALQPVIDGDTFGGSDLEIEIGGPNPGTDYDVIHVTGHATLAGKLHVTFINGFTPSPGQTFHVLDAGSLSGAFDLVTGADVTSLQGGLDLAAPGTVTITSTPKALVGCAGAIAKAGSGFAAGRLKGLDACAGGVFKCAQETDAGTKRDACIAKAGVACGKDLTKIDGLATKLTAAIDKACAPVGAADMLAPIGVGYLNVSNDCQSEFGTPLTTFASIEQCVLQGHDCRGEAIVNAQAPRAKELMRVAGVASNALDALACLPDDLGTGADLGAPKGAGKAITACEAAITKAGSAFAGKVQKSLTSCVGAVYACVTEKPTDGTCIPKAKAACAKDYSAIDTAGTALESAIEKSCASPPLGGTDLDDPTGADVQALTAACDAVGIGTPTGASQYGPCLVDLETCAAEDLVRLEAPRAGEMLALAGHALKSAFCP